MVSKISQAKKKRKQKTNIVWCHFYDVPRVVKFMETESRMVVARALEKGKIGSFPMGKMSIEFHLENV